VRTRRLTITEMDAEQDLDTVQPNEGEGAASQDEAPLVDGPVEGARSAAPTQAKDDAAFRVGADFAGGEVAGGLSLGPLEAQYEELFAEVLEDGVITSEERARLEKAADNLGLDPQRLLRLEQAMVASYETRHRVRVVERYEDAPASLSPIALDRPSDAGTTVLLKRIEQLEQRIAELEAELRDARAHINVEVDLGDLESAPVQAVADDPDDLWRRIRRDPTAPEAHEALYRLFKARGDQDRQWCLAQALVALGAADSGVRALFEEHAARSLMQPRASVSQAAWTDLLLHPEQEVLTGQIFAVIAPAVLIGRVTTLRRDRTLHRPDPQARQDPAKTTLTAVRAVAWASALLGLAAPPLYLEKDRAVGYEHIPGVPPITAVGKQVLSGCSQLELAFRAGRHMTMYRADHFVKTLFSSVADLEDLFLAALVIGSPTLPIAADMKARVHPVAKAIEPLLEPQHVDALRGHFLRFVEEGGRTNLQRWSAGVDKTAARAGFVLANDLGTALSVLEAEEGRLGELGKDVLVFATSERYFKLRRQLGISLTTT
jgi:hypothetical protein